MKKFDLSLLSRYKLPIMGVAAVMIMLFHSTVTYDHARMGIIWKVFSYGNSGVDMFLFLSGISLWFSYSKDANIKRFYKKRFTNIIPISFICIAIFIIVKCTLHLQEISKALYESISYGSHNPAWYVVLIVTLYAFYPLIYKVERLEGDVCQKAILSFFVMSIVALCYVWAAMNMEGYKQFESSVTRLPVFLIGCFYGKQVEERKKSVAWVLFSIGILVFKLLQKSLPTELAMVSGRFLSGCLGITLCFLLAALFKWTESALYGDFLIKTASVFGKMSLETYLIHNLAKSIFDLQGRLSLKIYFFVVLITCVLSIPVSRLRNSLYKKVRERRSLIDND